MLRRFAAFIRIVSLVVGLLLAGGTISCSKESTPISPSPGGGVVTPQNVFWVTLPAGTVKYIRTLRPGETLHHISSPYSIVMSWQFQNQPLRSESSCKNTASLTGVSWNEEESTLTCLLPLQVPAGIQVRISAFDDARVDESKGPFTDNLSSYVGTVLSLRGVKLSNIKPGELGSEYAVFIVDEDGTLLP